jgi:hypothetical protein
MLDEPVAGVRRCGVERAGLFEQVRRARNHDHVVPADKPGGSLAIEIEDRSVTSADDQSRRGTNRGETSRHKVGPAATRHDRGDR